MDEDTIDTVFFFDASKIRRVELPNGKYFLDYYGDDVVVLKEKK